MAMLPHGEAVSVHEAESRYLDTHLKEVVDLVNSPLSEAQFRRHPLIQMLFAKADRWVCEVLAQRGPQGSISTR